jgi:nuclear transport factor 2 (NTF2) superfamily protein
MSLKDLTEATVRGALEEYERLFSRLDVDGIVAGFADDVRVRYSNYEPFTGKERLKTFFTRRFAGMKDYRVAKRLEVLHPPCFAVSYTAEWIDSVTDARMEGFGTEILTVKDGLFNEWIASFSVWRHGDLVKIPGAKHQGGEA